MPVIISPGPAATNFAATTGSTATIEPRDCPDCDASRIDRKSAIALGCILLVIVCCMFYFVIQLLKRQRERRITLNQEAARLQRGTPYTGDHSTHGRWHGNDNNDNDDDEEEDRGRTANAGSGFGNWNGTGDVIHLHRIFKVTRPAPQSQRTDSVAGNGTTRNQDDERATQRPCRHSWPGVSYRAQDHYDESDMDPFRDPPPQATSNDTPYPNPRMPGSSSSSSLSAKNSQQRPTRTTITVPCSENAVVTQSDTRWCDPATSSAANRPGNKADDGFESLNVPERAAVPEPAQREPRQRAKVPTRRIEYLE